MTFKDKYDKLLYGIISGLLLPFITGLIVFLFSSENLTFLEYLVKLFLADIMTHAISLCVFPNILIFFLYMRFDMLRAARGVLGMTIIWAVIVFIVKII
jgi:hypothetical protein